MMFLFAMTLGCVPNDPCASMCSSATQHLGGCLELMGANWMDAGYTDAIGFFESCETWAWVTRKLEDEGGPSGATERQCIEWESQIESDGFICDDFDQIDWNTTPW
jgi:hypothetical protein